MTSTKLLNQTIETIITSICDIIEFARQRFGEVRQDADNTYIPSKIDKDLINKSKDIINMEFEEGFSCFIYNSNDEKISKVIALTKKIADCYGISIDNIIFSSTKELVEKGFPPNTCGYIEPQLKMIEYNTDLLFNNKLDNIKEVISTVIHECRHAYQYEAFYYENKNVDDKTKIKWGLNFANPILAQFDLEGYYKQEIEVDARNFTTLIMEDMEEQDD